MLPAKGFGATLSTADIVTPFTDYSRWERKPCRITLASKRRDSSEVIPPVCHHGHSYMRKKPQGRHIPPQASPQGKPPGKILAKKQTRPIARNLDPPNVRLLKVCGNSCEAESLPHGHDIFSQLQIATRGSSVTEYQQHQEELYPSCCCLQLYTKTIDLLETIILCLKKSFKEIFSITYDLSRLSKNLSLISFIEQVEEKTVR